MLQEDDTQQHSRDVERLEQMLSDRAREILELRSELERRAILIRDLTARWESLPSLPVSMPAAGAVSRGAHTDYEPLRQERDAAIARALDAEAAALEARFRIDELSGHLAKALERPEQRALEREQIATLEGAVRGLKSRIAETEDARDRAEARLMLAEHDVDDLRAEAATLKRQRLEMTERLELEALRARTADADVAALRGERLGLQARIDESEHAVAALQAKTESTVQAAEALEARVFIALAERDAARGALATTRDERDRVLVEANELRVEANELRNEANELRNELAQMKADLSTRQAELAEREADLATVRASQSHISDDSERATKLQEALLDARQGLRELSAWLANGGPAPTDLASTTSFELASPLGEPITSRPREDETMPGVPLHVQAIAAVETMAVEALEEQLAQKDEQLRALEARIDELMRRQGQF